MVLIDIDEADFSQIADYSTVAILGKRRSGKTTYASSIIQFLADRCDKFCIYCGNKDNIAEWRRIVPPLYVHTKSIEHVRKVRDYQDQTCSIYSNLKEPIPIQHRLTIVLDDCGSDTKFMHSDVMKDILSNGRHYGMYIFILVQYLNQMHAVNRDQLDYLGVLHTTNSKNVDKIYNEYCSACDRSTFTSILKALTAHRGLCWIDNTQSSDDIKQCIFYKELDQIPEPRPLGSDRVRSYSDQRFKSLDFVPRIIHFGDDLDFDTTEEQQNMRAKNKHVTVRKNRDCNRRHDPDVC